MDNNEMPREPLSSVYADAKSTITMAIRNVMQAYPLPIFMFESILDGFLSDLRAESKMELSADIQKYKEEFEKKVKDMQEQFEKEKDELIRQFENPDLSEETEPEEETTFEKRYIGDDEPETVTIGEEKEVD